MLSGPSPSTAFTSTQPLLPDPSSASSSAAPLASQPAANPASLLKVVTLKKIQVPPEFETTVNSLGSSLTKSQKEETEKIVKSYCGTLLMFPQLKAQRNSSTGIAVTDINHSKEIGGTAHFSVSENGNTQLVQLTLTGITDKPLIVGGRRIEKWEPTKELNAHIKRMHNRAKRPAQAGINLLFNTVTKSFEEKTPTVHYDAQGCLKPYQWRTSTTAKARNGDIRIDYDFAAHFNAEGNVTKLHSITMPSGQDSHARMWEPEPADAKPPASSAPPVPGEAATAARLRSQVQVSQPHVAAPAVASPSSSQHIHTADSLERQFSKLSSNDGEPAAPVAGSRKRKADDILPENVKKKKGKERATTPGEEAELLPDASRGGGPAEEEKWNIEWDNYVVLDAPAPAAMASAPAAGPSARAGVLKVTRATRYEDIKLAPKARRALDALPEDLQTAANLYLLLTCISADEKFIAHIARFEQLSPESKAAQLKTWSSPGKQSLYSINAEGAGYLRNGFDKYLKTPKRKLGDVLADFKTFAKLWKDFRGQAKFSDKGKKAPGRLREHCFPKLPFQQEVKSFPSTTSKDATFFSQVARVDAWLAAEGHTLDAFLPKDDLLVTLNNKRTLLMGFSYQDNIRPCMNLWRQQQHPLPLDKVFQDAITANYSLDESKRYLPKIPSLAEYPVANGMAELDFLNELGDKARQAQYAKWSGQEWNLSWQALLNTGLAKSDAVKARIKELKNRGNAQGSGTQ